MGRDRSTTELNTLASTPCGSTASIMKKLWASRYAKPDITKTDIQGILADCELNIASLELKKIVNVPKQTMLRFDELNAALANISLSAAAAEKKAIEAIIAQSNATYKILADKIALQLSGPQQQVEAHYKNITDKMRAKIAVNEIKIDIAELKKATDALAQKETPIINEFTTLLKNMHSEIKKRNAELANKIKSSPDTEEEQEIGFQKKDAPG